MSAVRQLATCTPVVCFLLLQFSHWLNSKLTMISFFLLLYYFPPVSLIFYASTGAIAAARGIMSLLCPSVHPSVCLSICVACELDISRTPLWNIFKLVQMLTWLKDELIRLWWPKVKGQGQGHCDLMAPPFLCTPYLKNALRKCLHVW